MMFFFHFSKLFNEIFKIKLKNDSIEYILNHRKQVFYKKHTMYFNVLKQKI